MSICQLAIQYFYDITSIWFINFWSQIYCYKIPPHFLKIPPYSNSEEGISPTEKILALPLGIVLLYCLILLWSPFFSFLNVDKYSVRRSIWTLNKNSDNNTKTHSQPGSKTCEQININVQSKDDYQLGWRRCVNYKWVGVKMLSIS